MFTGVVEEVGFVEWFEPGKILIHCSLVMGDLTMGASVAVNGVCLTAVALHTDGFSADLAQETLDKSNLGDLRVGDRVNLERPLMLSTRLSGHIVQGHVDGTGVLESLDEFGITVRVPPELDRFLVYKGSVCLDGISLTVASVQDGMVRVAIIPHTWDATNLRGRKVGDRINIECDILAKHVDKLSMSTNYSRTEPAITLSKTRKRIEATDVDMSGSGFTNVNLSGAAFNDVNLTGATIHNACLSGLRISDANLTGMTINGIAVEDLLAAYRAR